MLLMFRFDLVTFVMKAIGFDKLVFGDRHLHETMFSSFN